MQKSYYIYMTCNKHNNVLYIGVSNNIKERVLDHKIKLKSNSFTAKYNCDKLGNYPFKSPASKKQCHPVA